MTTVLLVRHAQSEWNAAGRWQGWADPPLSALGEAQAASGARSLGDAGLCFAAVVSSDLRRARDTAAILTGRRGGVPASPCPPPEIVAEDRDLRELDIGEWSGFTHEQIAERWPDALRDWRAGIVGAPPGGETRAEFDARVRRGVLAAATRHPSGQVLVVAHGGVVRSVAAWLGTRQQRVPNVGGLWLRHERSRLRVEGAVDLLGGEAAGDRGDGAPGDRRDGATPGDRGDGEAGDQTDEGSVLDWPGPGDRHL